MIVDRCINCKGYGSGDNAQDIYGRKIKKDYQISYFVVVKEGLICNRCVFQPEKYKNYWIKRTLSKFKN